MRRTVARSAKLILVMRAMKRNTRLCTVPLLDIRVLGHVGIGRALLPTTKLSLDHRHLPLVNMLSSLCRHTNLLETVNFEEEEVEDDVDNVPTQDGVHNQVCDVPETEAYGVRP